MPQRVSISARRMRARFFVRPIACAQGGVFQRQCRRTPCELCTSQSEFTPCASALRIRDALQQVPRSPAGKKRREGGSRGLAGLHRAVDLVGLERLELAEPVEARAPEGLPELHEVVLEPESTRMRGVGRSLIGTPLAQTRLLLLSFAASTRDARIHNHPSCQSHRRGVEVIQPFRHACCGTKPPQVGEYAKATARAGTATRASRAPPRPRSSRSIRRRSPRARCAACGPCCATSWRISRS